MNIDFLTKCSDIFYKLSSSEEEYGPELTEISAGTILYHGTSGEDDFIYPDGPAWFSDSEKVDMNFASEFQGGPNPRVFKYEVTSPLKLVLINTSEDMKKLSEFFDSEYSPRELAERMCDKFDGWHIPNNYPEGSDTLICNPEHCLKRIN